MNNMPDALKRLLAPVILAAFVAVGCTGPVIVDDVDPDPDPEIVVVDPELEEVDPELEEVDPDPEVVIVDAEEVDFDFEFDGEPPS